MNPDGRVFGDERPVGRRKEGVMKETTLQVGGMSCPSCIRHIDSALRRLGGVDEIDVRLREGIVVVQHDPARAPVAALVEAVRGAGYDVRPRAA
jgi:copper chaperone